MTMVTGNADSFLACVLVREESESSVRGDCGTEWASALSCGSFAPRWRDLSMCESHRDGSARGREDKYTRARQGGGMGVLRRQTWELAFNGRRHSPDISTLTGGRECRVDAVSLMFLTGKRREVPSMSCFSAWKVRATA